MKKLIGIITLSVMLIAAPAMACFGPSCNDDVVADAAGHVNAYDSASLFRDAGTRGVSAYADGRGAGEYSAHAEGRRFAHTEGWGEGNVDPSVGALGGRNYVGVGAMSEANSETSALAISDGGVRNTYAATYGGVYQNNSAYISAGPMTGAMGGNESGAFYFDSDSDDYNGSKIWRKWVNRGRGRGAGFYIYHYDRNGTFSPHPRSGWHMISEFCRPGMEYANSDGSAFTAGGTLLYSRQGEFDAASYGVTGSLSIGNDGVWGHGDLSTGAFVSDGMTEAGAFSSGTYSYNGNGFGAGITFGGSNVQIGQGSASAHSFQTSLSTGNNGGGLVD